jgi:hypothetical protein
MLQTKRSTLGYQSSSGLLLDYSPELAWLSGNRRTQVQRSYRCAAARGFGLPRI